MIQTSIIILTYNSSKYIKNLIESIYEFNHEKDFEVLVVDNDSSDKTIEIVKKFGSKVKIIETGANLGFAKGINYGAKKAIGEYLLFVNPDAEFKKGNIEQMVSVLEKDKKIGVVGGRLVNDKGINEKSAGKFFGFFASILMAFGLDESFGIRFSPNVQVPVDFVSGGFMMVRSALFSEQSGFDENLFMYIEDMEFCYRVKRSGFRTVFTPYAIAFHAGHGSGSRGFAIKNIYRGILYFHKKHGTAFSYFIVRELFRFKAFVLVFIGKMINNKYLTETYREALTVF